MPRLGVNIDHVATLRQARGGREPDPVWAAVLAELGGADVITIHLREDRRHIQDRDLLHLRDTVQVRLNLELAVEPGVVALALQVGPDQVTFVPERREELTTEGGLDVAGQRERVADTLARCRDAGMEVALFIDPDLKQVQAAIELVLLRSSCTPAVMPTPPPGAIVSASLPHSSAPARSSPTRASSSTRVTASTTKTSRRSLGSAQCES